MNDDGLSQLRSSRQRSPALRIAQGPPHPRLVEGPPPAQVVAPETRRSSFWQLSLSGIPIIASLVSTSLLAYFVLSVQNSQPFAQLQQEPPQQLAQKAPEQPNPQEAKPEPQAAPPVRMPSDDVLLMLIRSTLIALNQANTTGNYTVFREMGAPGFQEANSPAQLTESFADLRHRNLDLSPILLFQPKLFRRPEINAQGFLRVTGFFPTAPEQVNFDLIFQPVQGKWRLFGVAANARGQPDADAPAQPQAAPAETPKEAAKARPASKPSTPEGKVPANATAPKADDPEPELDIRDRLENPPAPPPAQQKPKSSSDPFSGF